MNIDSGSSDFMIYSLAPWSALLLGLNRRWSSFISTGVDVLKGQKRLQLVCITNAA